MGAARPSLPPASPPVGEKDAARPSLPSASPPPGENGAARPLCLRHLPQWGRTDATRPYATGPPLSAFGISPTGGDITPPGGGGVGAELTLAYLVVPTVGFWIVVGLMALAEAAIVAAALRMPVRAVERRGIWGARPAETVWTLLPVLLLTLLVVMSLRSA